MAMLKKIIKKWFCPREKKCANGTCKVDRDFKKLLEQRKAANEKFNN
jgi:hypothetical protein